MNENNEEPKWGSTQEVVQDVESKEVSTSESEYSVKYDEYKGNKTIILFKKGRKLFGFGLTKAKAIIALIDTIKKFVSDNEGK